MTNGRMGFQTSFAVAQPMRNQGFQRLLRKVSRLLCLATRKLYSNYLAHSIHRHVQN